MSEKMVCEKCGETEGLFTTINDQRLCLSCVGELARIEGDVRATLLVNYGPDSEHRPIPGVSEDQDTIPMLLRVISHLDESIMETI